MPISIDTSDLISSFLVSIRHVVLVFLCETMYFNVQYGYVFYCIDKILFRRQLLQAKWTIPTVIDFPYEKRFDPANTGLSFIEAAFRATTDWHNWSMS